MLKKGSVRLLNENSMSQPSVDSAVSSKDEAPNKKEKVNAKVEE